MNQTGRGWGVPVESTVVSQMKYSFLRWRIALRPSLDLKSITGFSSLHNGDG
jgi:hypothetical protein